MKTRVAIQTLGCKLNQAESEWLARDLARRGYRVVSHLESYDVCVVNTCTVTSLSDRKSRNLLRRARANNPAARLIAAGCYARTSEMQISGVGRGIVAHTHGIESLPDLLDARFGPVAGTGHGAYLGRTRSFVKVQEGCNRHCTYCVVPLARGEERSVDLETVLRQVRDRVAEGYQEIVLTGTNVGSYRSGGFGLTRLIGMILGRTAVSRLRISSLQPDDISDDLLAAFQDPRLCPHIHMPLQSGSPGVLRRM
ncbi:MAG: radical SAM protein, partial [Chloroflexi bacterium]|nr:radical SAM protein [Chloroflexota bacterium]